MNSTSAFATLTVIILITRYKINNFSYFPMIMLAVSLANAAVGIVGINQFILESIISIILRYLSDLSYSIFLIYTIETFPTVCRSQGLALALCGGSFGVILAYSLSTYRITELVLCSCFNMLLVIRSKFIQLDYENKLMDTLTD